MDFLLESSHRVDSCIKIQDFNISMKITLVSYLAMQEAVESCFGFFTEGIHRIDYIISIMWKLSFIEVTKIQS